jgi:hypothetical protein
LTNGKSAAEPKVRRLCCPAGTRRLPQPDQAEYYLEIGRTLVWNWYNSMMYAPLSGDPAQLLRRTLNSKIRTN